MASDHEETADSFGELNISDISGILSNESIKSVLSESMESNLYWKLMLDVLQLYLKHNLTLEALMDIFQILQKCPGNKTFPLTIYKFFQLFPKQFTTTRHIKCEKCGNYTETKEFRTNCIACKKEIKTMETNYFECYSVRDQIEMQVKKHWDSIENHFRQTPNGNIRDFSDGKVHAELHSDTKFKFSLTLNTDGAKRFKSNAKSIWPLLLVQNYLPPNIRFKRENVILVGIHYGKKPVMQDFCFPLIREMCNMHEHPLKITIDGKEISITPHITSISCDLPAKAIFQQINQYNGYFACSICLHPGVKLENLKNKAPIIRYEYTEEADIFEERSTNQMLNLMLNA